MEDLRKDQTRLAGKARYTKAIDQVQEMIDLLTKAKATINESPSAAPIQLAKLKQPVKKSFDVANSNLKEIHSGLKDYEKALNKVGSRD
jgi:hypothetical protein